MEESVKPDKHNKQKCPLMMYTLIPQHFDLN